MNFRGILSILAVAAFLAALLLGSYAMTHHQGEVCLVALAKGTECPNVPLVSATMFHIEALKSFSLAAFSEILALGAILALLVAGSLYREVFLPPRLLHHLGNIFAVVIPRRTSRLLAWSALHEHSPTRNF